MILNGFQEKGNLAGIDIGAATVTLVSSSFVYDGSVKTQEVQSVVLDGITLIENTDYFIYGNKQTNAGTYTLSVVGIGQYSGTIISPWSITKATPTITLSETEIEVDEEDTATITVSTNSDGAISVSSNDTAVATVSISGNTITISGLAEGEATITVSVASTNNYNTVSITCSVEVGTSIPAVLSDCTPEQIQTAARNGIASSLWSVGDVTAPITISSSADLPNFTPPSEGVCAFIIGFDHNSSIEGTGIQFQFGKTIAGTDIAFVDSSYGDIDYGYSYVMFNDDTESWIWKDSCIRLIICPLFLEKLPLAWQNVIVETVKYTADGYSDNVSITPTSDKLFLLAEYEVFGTRTYAVSTEQDNQAQYAFYSNGNSKIKYKHSNTSTACKWWLRSARSVQKYIGCCVSVSGSASYEDTDVSFGFAPAFRIA